MHCDLIGQDGLRVAVYLVRFGAEVLDGLEVEHGVDALGALVVVRQVHAATVLGAPLRHVDSGRCEDIIVNDILPFCNSFLPK